MAKVHLLPIVPKKPIAAESVHKFRSGVVVALADEAKQIEKLFGQATRTWKAQDQPRWKTIFILSDDAEVNVLTDSTPFVYVEGGTRKRLRRMSRDFIAKTYPGVLASGPGAGGAAGWYPRSKPAKGIKARNFRVAVVRVRHKKFRNKMRQVVRSSVV